MSQPRPPHWSDSCPAFRRDLTLDNLANYATGLDELAEAAGVDDGSVLLVKELGVTAEQARHATRSEAGRWFSALYARYGPPLHAQGDAVAFPVGIYDAEAGWAPFFDLSYDSPVPPDGSRRKGRRSRR